MNSNTAKYNVNDELSDRAYAKWKQGMQVPFEREAWRECRRRSQDQIGVLLQTIHDMAQRLDKERRAAFMEAWKTCAFLWDGDSSDAYISEAYRAWREKEGK